MDRSSRQKINKEGLALKRHIRAMRQFKSWGENDTLEQVDLTDIQNTPSERNRKHSGIKPEMSHKNENWKTHK